ncbi:ras-related protein Rab-30-like isoform X1 [Xenia sp. Carnegie-2017]|uniref:ras-related protein Rab-30-like isoform X1 n=1 Tax=Xenia sp. Carnegie-2017 TaxID=2897299 RepID=UPI001F040B37|nr:ras-related protein Rab-30-like isoform X1 [Xenia sp. Carnegie-2017]
MRPHQGKIKSELKFKIAFVGNAGVGKTSLMMRYTQESYRERRSTLGICNYTKILRVDDEPNVKLEIWDTAGQERYRTITQSYYRDANGLILTYDITQLESLACLRDWIEDVRRYANKSIRMILVGTKLDVAERQREVTEEQARKFASHYPDIVDVVETSSKNNTNVDMVFIKLCQALKEEHDVNATGTMNFNDVTLTKKKRSYCRLCKISSCCI